MSSLILWSDKILVAIKKSIFIPDMMYVSVIEITVRHQLAVVLTLCRLLAAVPLKCILNLANQNGFGQPNVDISWKMANG